MKKYNIIILFILISFQLFAQKESPDVRTGNKFYNSEKYTEAEVEYRKGLQKNPASFEANYNLGNSLFRQNKYKEALEQYKIAAALQPGDKVKVAASFHNTGNSLLAEKKIEESIEAYKMAPKANPKDNDTRFNLAFAQALLKKQKNDKDKDKDKNKDKEKEKDKEQQQPKPQPQQPQMTKQNAQQILDALMQDEKDALDKAKQQQVRGKKSADKDW